MNHPRFETVQSNELTYKYQRLKEKMKVIKAENENYLKINELLQGELNQKSAALEASSRSFQALKLQYEELLQRLTEIHFSSFSSSANSDVNIKKETDDEVVKLKQIIVEKDAIIEKLQHDLLSYKNNDSKIDQIYKLILEFKQKRGEKENAISVDRQKYIYQSINDLITMLTESEAKREKTERRIKYILTACNKLTKIVSEERIRITQIIKSNEASQDDDFLDQEFRKLRIFIQKANKKYNISNSIEF
ncbi:hypothetical protein TVAG_120310 [Trichomonas vaginalis G3]|uniref:Uncharacterized protein n=1 Tax=Trichomonas vaginalis (strain ATCC PRA-98 / G3) TaxID=412133 RepID=A2D7H6_TRIV3|nr:hypothetical protein TVAGG3_0993330 [Trichomonas vaginalis G3]EAY23693.1 hypothetical protein TVAG_120310 [Trichomonas vaginalis G3]KAI5490188.1 hypothetical protein TVAGG3_0993330 [Trichomonas vaginalis G3]|eukprot:XP_001276941.1 hypothetical protein [Trichomonas vaginalis G3]